MLVPRFTCTQTSDRVTLVIAIPHLNANADDADYVLVQHRSSRDQPFMNGAELVPAADGEDPRVEALFTEVRFSAGPYFLRVVFPRGCVLLDEEDDSITLVEERRKHVVNYDAVERAITLDLPKAAPGKDFGDLELLTRLRPAEIATRSGASRVEVPPSDGSRVIVSDGSETNSESDSDDLEERVLREMLEVGGESEHSFVIGQQADDNVTGNVFPTDSAKPGRLGAAPHMGDLTELRYGFNSLYSGYFQDMARPELLIEVLDNLEPEHFSRQQRRQMRLAREGEDFNPDAVEMDFVFDDGVRECLEFRPDFQEKSSHSNPKSRHSGDSGQYDNILGSAGGQQPFVFGTSGVRGADATGVSRTYVFAPPPVLAKPTEPQHETAKHAGSLDPSSLVDHVVKSKRVSSNPTPFQFGAQAKPQQPATGEDEADAPRPAAVTFTERERDALRALPNRELLVSKGEVAGVYCVLVDLLFSWAYNMRSTQGENTCESSWTMVKLSPALSWLDDYWLNTGETKRSLKGRLARGVRQVLVGSMERALCYPLFRNFELCFACAQDVAAVLETGRRQVLRCLLDMKDVFDHSDTHFHQSRLFVDDFCIFLQSDACRERALRLLSRTIQSISATELRGAIRWDLDELEARAKLRCL